MITQTIDLCMIPGSTNPVIHVNQYDAYPGGLIFNLYEESAFEIPAGAAVTINGTKPDNYGFSYTATYSGNVVTADLEQQMTAVAGNVECELRVSLGSEIIGTQNFTLCVEEAALNNETIISDSDMPAIANAQRYASEAAASAAEAASTLASTVKYTDIVNNGTYSGAAGEKVLDAAYGKTLEDNKVAKSGDTMTGALSIKDESITVDTVPSTSIYSDVGLHVQDSVGTDLGFVKPFYRNDDISGLDIGTARLVNSSAVYNTINLKIDNAGGRDVSVSDSSAWFRAVNNPKRINSGSINDLTAPGFYYLVYGSVADLPEGANGNLWVFDGLGDGTRFVQIFRRIGESGTNDQNIYIRGRNAGGAWGTWWKYSDGNQYVAKTGDTMTGNLTMNANVITEGNHNYYSHGTDASVNTTPSSNYWGHGLVLQDAAGADFGYVKSFHMNDGTRGMFIESRPGLYNTLRLGSNGTTPYVYISQPAAWADALQVKQYNNSISLGSIPVTAFVTNGQKRLLLSIPYPNFSGTNMTISSLSMVLRHVGGSNYVYVRSGTDGATYTSLGSGQTSLIANGAAVRTNEIASFSVTLKEGWGFTITINFNYQMCSTNTGTVITNNTPMVADISLTGTIS